MTAALVPWRGTYSKSSIPFSKAILVIVVRQRVRLCMSAKDTNFAIFGLRCFPALSAMKSWSTMQASIFIQIRCFIRTGTQRQERQSLGLKSLSSA